MLPPKDFVLNACIAFGLVSILYAVMATAYERTLIFKEPIPEKALPGHVIRAEKVPNEGGCRVKCYLEPNCVSINVGPATEGQLMCELNNHTDESPSHSSLKERKHYIHYAVENFCHGDPCPENVSFCQVGFTSKGYKCVCHEGYTATGDHGQCEDINECQSHLHSCKPGYKCENMAGSFFCKCPSGFVEENNICRACNKALGMQNRAISNGQITASSERRSALRASQGRLHNSGGGGNAWGAWSAKTTNQEQWLQVDLIQTITVSQLATQGRGNRGSIDSWVTKYKLQHSNDGKTFETYPKNGPNKDKEFAGNTDRNTVVYNDLNPPIRARYIRFRPTAWHKRITMRVELYGCDDETVYSCQSLRSLLPRPRSGVYWINPDSESPANRFKAYCDMETDGGGWTLVWSYRFTNYEDFTEKSNAITPRPDWPAKPEVDVLISTTPPLNETDYDAIKFSLWKQLGREILIKSNINNWLICNPGTGSLVDWQDGSVSCTVINRVTDGCNKTEAPYRFTATEAFGPWLSGSEKSQQIHYYFDGYTKEHWPAHDPCGKTKPNHLQDVDNPHGNIFVR